jgi:hypothetical protein
MKIIKPYIFSFVFIFISGYLHSQTPLNWTRDEVNPGEDFTLFQDDNLFTEGLKSCHMQLNSGAIPYLKSEVYYITPGVQYEFSFDVMDNDTAGQVKVYADFYDTFGFNVYGLPPVFSTDSPDWQTKSWTGTVPTNAVVGYVLIKFYNQPNYYTFTKNADIWLDNFKFRENGGNNLIANGGFEDWIVGVDENSVNDDLISIYPNPADDFVNLSLREEIVDISISDISGKQISRVDVSGKRLSHIDVSQMPAGVYFIKGILKDKSTVTKKLMVN